MPGAVVSLSDWSLELNVGKVQHSTIGEIMKMLVLMMSILLTLNLYATERLSNPCWNTNLSDRLYNVCQVICLPLADEQAPIACKEEREIVDACLADFENCSNYSELLIQKQNCWTSLVRKCFYRY